MQFLIGAIKAAADTQSALVLVLLIFAGSLYFFGAMLWLFVRELRGSIKGHREDMSKKLDAVVAEQRVQNAELRVTSTANTDAVRACTEVTQLAVALLQRESRHHPASVLLSLDALHPKVDEIVTLGRATGQRVMELSDQVSAMRDDMARMERESLERGVRQLRGGSIG